MSDMYFLIDKATRNILDERETFDEAEAVLHAYVGNQPSAADDLEIIGPDGRRHSVTRRQAEQAPATAAELAEA